MSEETKTWRWETKKHAIKCIRAILAGDSAAYMGLTRGEAAGLRVALRALRGKRK